MEMKSSSSPPPSLPDFLQRAVKALAPPILGACLAVGMPLIAPAELSPEQKLVCPLPAPDLLDWRAPAFNDKVLFLIFETVS